MKTLLKILLTAMAIIFPVFLYGQNYYAGKDSMLCNGVNYRIKHYSFTNDILIENKANFLRNNLRHKVGSTPVVYYSEATGMGHFADSDNEKFQQIVSQVFSDEEIRLYKTASGSVYLSYVVDPVGGKVLEVRFDICLSDNDMTMLSIPIEKFWKLEILLKEQLVCHISEELKAERQSYTLSGDSLFAE